ncbi:MAG: TolC family protein [Candidatus Solibacter sp.]
MKLTWAVPLLLASCAAAQSPLSIQEAVETALRSHPVLNAAAARTGASSGLLTQAGLKPNVRLTLQTENWRFYGTPSFSANTDVDTFAYLTKPLETGGKRERRVDFAAAGVRRSEEERQVLARQIALRVRQAYWNAAGAEKLHRLLTDSALNFQQIVEYHEKRVREGALAEADLIKVQLEQQRLNVSVHSAALDVERARLQLFREMGLSDTPAVTLSELPGQVEAPPAGADLAAATARRPEIALARRAVEQARANVALQKANARPDLDLMAGYKRTTGFSTVMGGVQVALPFSNRNQGAITAAEAEVRAAESDLHAMELAIASEIRTAEAEVRSQADELTRLFGAEGGSGLRGKAAESSNIAQAAYREGGTDLLRLLDAERVRIELQVLYYRTLTGYRQSVVALEAALGVNP